VVISRVSVTVLLAESVASHSDELGRGAGAAPARAGVETGAGSAEGLCCLPAHARAAARVAVAGVQNEGSF